MTQFLGYHDLC